MVRFLILQKKFELCLSYPKAIKTVKAREIIDSRGNPTVEVDLTTDKGFFRASVPSGASTGAYEAVELRDGGSRYGGKGVLRAVQNVNTILGPAIIGMDETDQFNIDGSMILMDPSLNKANMGANAILGISLAVAKAGAFAKGVPLYQHFADLAGNKELVMPVPSFNVINGGSHAGNGLAFQEFMVLPTGASSFAESMQIGCEIYASLKSVTKKQYGQDAVNVGDEGGFAPPIKNNKEGVQLLMNAIEKAGHLDKIILGMDVASSEFFVDGKYDLAKKSRTADSNEPMLSSEELGAFYKDLCKEFPIYSIEDAFDQDDWEGWTKFTSAVGKDIQIVGDDLTVTNPDRIEKAAKLGACNALLLKVNQIGSISESIRAVQLAKQSGWGVMTSHRSGETEDNYIADLAVGLCTGQIKTGAPCRSERLAKYNQLLRIEDELKAKTSYAGKSFRQPAWMG
jgi:enolase